MLSQRTASARVELIGFFWVDVPTTDSDGPQMVHACWAIRTKHLDSDARHLYLWLSTGRIARRARISGEWRLERRSAGDG